MIPADSDEYKTVPLASDFASSMILLGRQSDERQQNPKSLSTLYFSSTNIASSLFRQPKESIIKKPQKIYSETVQKQVTSPAEQLLTESRDIAHTPESQQIAYTPESQQIAHTPERQQHLSELSDTSLQESYEELWNLTVDATQMGDGAQAIEDTVSQPIDYEYETSMPTQAYTLSQPTDYVYETSVPTPTYPLDQSPQHYESQPYVGQFVPNASEQSAQPIYIYPEEEYEIQEVHGLIYPDTQQDALEIQLPQRTFSENMRAYFGNFINKSTQIMTDFGRKIGSFTRFTNDDPSPGLSDSNEPHVVVPESVTLPLESDATFVTASYEMKTCLPNYFPTHLEGPSRSTVLSAHTIRDCNSDELRKYENLKNTLPALISEELTYSTATGMKSKESEVEPMHPKDLVEQAQEKFQGYLGSSTNMEKMKESLLRSLPPTLYSSSSTKPSSKMIQSLMHSLRPTVYSGSAKKTRQAVSEELSFESSTASKTLTSVKSKAESEEYIDSSNVMSSTRTSKDLKSSKALSSARLKSSPEGASKRSATKRSDTTEKTRSSEITSKSFTVKTSSRTEDQSQEMTTLSRDSKTTSGGTSTDASRSDSTSKEQQSSTVKSCSIGTEEQTRTSTLERGTSNLSTTRDQSREGVSTSQGSEITHSGTTSGFTKSQTATSSRTSRTLSDATTASHTGTSDRRISEFLHISTVNTGTSETTRTNTSQAAGTKSSGTTETDKTSTTTSKRPSRTTRTDSSEATKSSGPTEAGTSRTETAGTTEATSLATGTISNRSEESSGTTSSTTSQTISPAISARPKSVCKKRSFSELPGITEDSFEHLQQNRFSDLPFQYEVDKYDLRMDDSSVTVEMPELNRLSLSESALKSFLQDENTEIGLRSDFSNPSVSSLNSSVSLSEEEIAPFPSARCSKARKQQNTLGYGCHKYDTVLHLITYKVHAPNPLKRKRKPPVSSKPDSPKSNYPGIALRFWICLFCLVFIALTITYFILNGLYATDGASYDLLYVCIVDLFILLVLVMPVTGWLVYYSYAALVRKKRVYIH